MKFIATLFALLMPLSAQALDGYDYESDAYVEIDRHSRIKPGRSIDIYDYTTGRYKEVEVQSVTGKGRGAEVEVYDYETGKFRMLELE